MKRLTPTAQLPARSSEHASCFDIYADMDGALAPGDRLLVKTGLSVAVPPGFEVQVLEDTARGGGGFGSTGR